MKTLELEKMGLEPMTISEMRDSNGGLLVGLWNLLAEAGKFIITEGADFVQGVGEGYNYVRN